jgi:hypothetical protein
MVRAFEKILRLAGNDLSRRRRHQFVPSISGAASRLEDRALLNGAGGTVHAAAASLASTPAGRHVTRTYEQIFGAAPTQQQVRQFVHEIRAGRSFAALHRQLVVEARVQARAAAAASGHPRVISTVGSTPARFGAGNGTTNRAHALPAGLTNSFLNPQNTGTAANFVSPGVSQLPAGMAVSLASSSTLVTKSIALTTGTTATTGTPTGTRGTTGTTTGTTVLNTTAGTTTTGSPLTVLLSGGTVPTPGLTTGSTGATVGTTPTATITFTPATFANSPINASPVPANGVLPFTRSPVNPSPVPANGVLPFTGTPINPSPVPVNGALPFTTL